MKIVHGENQEKVYFILVTIGTYTNKINMNKSFKILV